MSPGSLQRYCNKEGFNAMSKSGGHSKARIGFLGNNENTCGTCDSRIGFNDDPNTCGNEAISTWYSDRGDRHIKAMGYILVQ